MLAPFRWLFNNLSTLLLSFALAMVVWISAVTSANPNEERVFTVPIEFIGLDPNMLIVESGTAQVRVTLRAPRSVWDAVNNAETVVTAWVDVTGLGPGTHLIDVNTQISESIRPVRKGLVNPERVSITLETLTSRSIPVTLEITGEPAIGYQKGLPGRNPSFSTLSGPESHVNKVEKVVAFLDISDASETIKTTVPLRALNDANELVPEVTLTPGEITVTQPISLLGGYRNVVVKVVTTGQVANGYKLTNVSVSPPNVIVFSTDPRLVNELPSYVETEPLSLTGEEDDIDTLLALNLPTGISVVGDQSVLVQVSIAAIEGSLTISLPVKSIGLLPTLAAQISPDNVDVILTGPVPILNNITPSDIRVAVDLKGLEEGTHQINLVVDVVPERLNVESILPSAVEVIIGPAPTPTPTSQPTPTTTALPSG